MFASEHLHHEIPTRGHWHHGIPTMGHLHHKSCIFERRHVHHMDISHLHPCKRTFASEMKNLDLHHILFAFIEDGHQ